MSIKIKLKSNKTVYRIFRKSVFILFSVFIFLLCMVWYQLSMVNIKYFLHIFFLLRVLAASYQRSPKTAEITEGVILAIGYDLSNMILVEGFLV